MAVKLHSSSNALVNASIYASAYEAVLNILGSGGVILPLGDPVLGKLGAATFTTARNSASGVAATFTWNEAPASFDVAPSVKGFIPVIEFNGTNEEADSPDAAYWSFGADGTAPNEPTFSVSMWVKLKDAASSTFIARRVDTTASELREWFIGTDANGFIECRLFDESADAIIGREFGTALVTGQWIHIVVTYSGSAVASGVKIYQNGIQVDDANVTSGVYVAMENLAVVTKLGTYIGTGGVDVNLFDGSMMGGPNGPALTDKELTAEEVLRLHHLESRLAGLS